MIESILRKINNVKKAADVLSIWMFFIAATTTIIGSIVELVCYMPNIPLIIVTTIIRGIFGI